MQPSRLPGGRTSIRASEVRAQRLREILAANVDQLVTTACQVGEHGWSQPRWMPAVESFDALALRFLGVDPVRLEAERRAMLAAIGGGGA
ncbi:MAG: hypothetical protein U0869_21930 [Chloroflexota bacterium]